MSFQNLPDSRCLPQPTIYQRVPNQAIQLYEGFAEIMQGSKIVEGNVTLCLVWFPHPHINFNFTHFIDTNLLLSDVTLNLTEFGISVKSNISQQIHYSADNRQIISGDLCEPIVKGRIQDLASLVFHLSNFPDFQIFNTLGLEEEGEEEIEGWLDWFFVGQLAFQVGDWRIILSTLPDTWEIEELLQSQGGYAMTHVCKLERVDLSLFSVNDAREQLKAFSHYLSFARGLRIEPMLLTGFNAKGEQVFQEWSANQADSWQNTYPSWFYVDSISLVEGFPGFMRKWQDVTWQELVEQSIHWYVESSKQAGGVDGAIVLQQTALERLAYVLLVEKKCILSQDGFNKLPAADKIRLLISTLGIGLQIPDDLTNLIQMSNEFNWTDGSQAIAEIRNAIVHPNSKNRHKGSGASKEAKHEALALGLQYLEQVLLKLFDYPYV